jgi:hypothetical protein
LLLSESVIVLLRTMVGGGGFRSLARKLWPPECFDQDESGVERLGTRFWAELEPWLDAYDPWMGTADVQMLRKFFRVDVEIDAAMRLPAEIEGTRPQPTLRTGLSLITAEILSNIFQHTFPSVPDSLENHDRRHGVPAVLRFKTVRHPSSCCGCAESGAFDLLIECTPGSRERGPRAAQLERAAGLKSLPSLASAVGASFRHSVTVGSVTVPWFEAEEVGGGVVKNVWALRDIPAEGVIYDG